MDKKREIPFFVVVLVLLLVSGAWLMGRAGLALGAGLEPTLSPELAQIATLQSALDSGQGDALVRASLQEKLQMAVRIATQQAQALLVTPEVGPQEGVTPYPTPVFETLLFEGSEGLVQPSTASVQNGWQGTVDGTRLQLFAGAAADDPRQGVLILVTFDTAAGGRSMAVFTAPQKQGWLRIVSVQDGLFELISEDGLTSYYDLRSGEFSQP